MNSDKFIEGLSIAATILTILASATVSAKISSEANPAAAAEAVYEWSRLEYEIAEDPGIEDRVLR